MKPRITEDNWINADDMVPEQDECILTKDAHGNLDCIYSFKSFIPLMGQPTGNP